jgi:hypothetical protein
VGEPLVRLQCVRGTNGGTNGLCRHEAKAGSVLVPLAVRELDHNHQTLRLPLRVSGSAVWPVHNAAHRGFLQSGLSCFCVIMDP